MTRKDQVLIGCTALAISLGMARAVTPAAADTQTAHQASKMMRHRPVLLSHHRHGRAPLLHRRLVHH